VVPRAPMSHMCGYPGVSAMVGTRLGAK
jgi:hypothetical protein